MICDFCNKTPMDKFYCGKCIIKELSRRREGINSLKEENAKLQKSIEEELRKKEILSKSMFFLQKKNDLVHYLEQKIKEEENEISKLEKENSLEEKRIEFRRNEFIMSREILQNNQSILNEKLGRFKVERERFKNSKKLEELERRRRRAAQQIFTYLPVNNEIKSPLYQYETLYKNRLYVFSKHLYLPLAKKLKKLDVKNDNFAACMGFLVMYLNLFSWYMNVKLRHQMIFKGNFSKIRSYYDDRFYNLYFDESIKPIESAEKNLKMGLILFNENLTIFCIQVGFNVVPKKLGSFIQNLLSIRRYTQIGKLGPFTYYAENTSTKLDGGPRELLIRSDEVTNNYFVEDGKYTHELIVDNNTYNVESTYDRLGSLMRSKNTKIWPPGYKLEYYVDGWLDKISNFTSHY